MWTLVPPENKVGIGSGKGFQLNPRTQADFTTSEFTGCTVVIGADGHNVMFAHIAQEVPVPDPTPGIKDQVCLSMVNRRVVDTKVKDIMLNAFDNFDGHPDTKVWIYVATGGGSGPNSYGYQQISLLLQENGVPRANIRALPYAGTSGEPSGPSSPRGKAVITWNPQGGGGAILAVYLQEDLPTFEQKYNANGVAEGAPVCNRKRRRDGSDTGCVPPGYVTSLVNSQQSGHTQTTAQNQHSDHSPRSEAPHTTDEAKSHHTSTSDTASDPQKTQSHHAANPHTTHTLEKTQGEHSTIVKSSHEPGHTAEPSTSSEPSKSTHTAPSRTGSSVSSSSIAVFLSKDSVSVGNADNAADGKELRQNTYDKLKSLCPSDGHTCHAHDSATISGIDAVINGGAAEVELEFTITDSNYDTKDDLLRMLAAAVASWERATSKSCKEESYVISEIENGHNCHSPPFTRRDMLPPMLNSSELMKREPCVDCDPPATVDCT